MPIIKVSDLKSGAILTEDIVNDQGNILINSGRVVDERVIDILKSKNISEVAINEVPTEEPDQPSSTKTQSVGENSAIAITINVSYDKMQAFVDIKSSSEEKVLITEEMIKKAMLDSDVVFGYRDSDIRSLVEKFNRTQTTVEDYLIANGIKAMPGKQGDLSIPIPYISNKEDYKLLTSEKYAYDVKGLIKTGMRVDPNTIIGNRLDLIEPHEGSNVCGDPIVTKEIVKVDIKFGSNVESNSDNTQFMSTITGVVCFIDNTISVFPICFDFKPILSVSPDKMEAKLTVFPPCERGRYIEESDIKEILSQNNISFGISNEKIQEVVEESRKGIIVKEKIIAKGIPPVNGKDGEVEYLFNADKKARPSTREDGSVNFKDINLVESTKKGQELARLIPPTEGTPGKNIFEEEIPCEPGIKVELLRGPNTELKDDDPSVLVASLTGFVKLKGNVIEVNEGYYVKGDVDYKTGNIAYPKTVIITGDVKSGFSIKAGEDIEVKGTVEDANVESDASILVKLGIIGTGKGIISAKRDITAAFVRNQNIKSRRNVFIAREAIGAKIWAKNSIEVRGKPISIAGGKISARNEIKAYSIGNESGTKTEIEVGTDFTLIEEKQKTEDKINDLKNSAKKVDDNLRKLRHIKRLRKSLQPQEEFLLKKLENMEEKIEAQLGALEKRFDVISKKAKEIGKSIIFVERVIHPGTVIKIGERHMVVNKEILGPKTIMLVKGEIKVA